MNENNNNNKNKNLIEKNIIIKNYIYIFISSQLSLIILLTIKIPLKIKFIFFILILISFLLLFSFKSFFFRLKEYLTMLILLTTFSTFLIDITKTLIYNKNNIYYQIEIYLISLCIYHISEYINSLIYHFNKLDWSCYLIDQSWEWFLALFLSIIEYFIEIFFLNFKTKTYIIFNIGMFFIIFGHFLRISALFTCKTNFEYLVQYTRQKGHKLVKNGVYKIFRHPSYVGFYLWAVGTQIMMCNIICIVGFIVALYVFFKERIEEEEIYLVAFFGEEYLNYRKETFGFFKVELNEKDVEIALKNFEEKYKNKY